MSRERLPIDDELATINIEHAPNWAGHTLLQRVAIQLTNDCVKALRAGDRVKAKSLSEAADKMERLAFAANFDDAYQAAVEYFTPAASLPVA